MKSDLIINYLNELIPDAKCELDYNKGYELLIATVLSAQCTDARVNMVTRKLWSKYDIYSLAYTSISEIERIIKPVGTFRRKAVYLKLIAKELVDKYNGEVPNDFDYLVTLPGVGRKTANVVLSNLYGYDAIAVDTHVNRVSKRLGIVKNSDDVFVVEKKLCKFFPRDKWSRLHHQLVLFGRYYCKAVKPMCNGCGLRDTCRYKSKK